MAQPSLSPGQQQQRHRCRRKGPQPSQPSRECVQAAYLRKVVDTVNDLASTKYCLADPGKTYVVYIPSGGKVKVSLGEAKNRFAVEWIHPSTGKAVAGDAVTGGTATSSPLRSTAMPCCTCPGNAGQQVRSATITWILNRREQR